MRHLFDEAPFFVGGRDMSPYYTHDLEQRLHNVAEDKGMESYVAGAGKH